jgi:hypothetical protein
VDKSTEQLMKERLIHEGYIEVYDAKGKSLGWISEKPLPLEEADNKCYSDKLAHAR